MDNCQKSKVGKLDRIQKRSVRIIDGCKHKGMRNEELQAVYGLEDLKVRLRWFGTILVNLKYAASNGI